MKQWNLLAGSPQLGLEEELLNQLCSDDSEKWSNNIIIDNVYVYKSLNFP